MNGELRMGRTEWVLLIVLAAIWGSSFPFYKIMVAEIPPMTIALGRTAIAAGALLIMVVIRGERLRLTARDCFWFAVCGLLNNAIPYSLLAFSEIRLSAGLASILNATTPIFGIIVAHFLTSNERFSTQRFLGVLLGFAGVAVLVGPGVAAELTTGDTGRLIAEAACLLAAVTYAFGSVFSRRLARHSTLTIATGQVSASAVLMVVPALVFDRPWTLPLPDSDVIGALVTIGLMCTAFAYLLFFRIMRVAGVTNILLVTLLVPVSALLLAAVLLHETVRPNAYVGMALIGSGLLAIDGRVLRVMRLRAA